MRDVQNYISTNSPAGLNTADLVLTNGKIYTVDPGNRWAEAVAIKNGCFLAVGSTTEILALCDGDTQIVDLKGRFAMPGLYDMHTHPDLALAPKYADDLDVGLGNPTPDDVKAAILKYADDHPEKEWIFGQCFVNYTFKQAELEPGKEWLDSFIPDRPVAIMDRMWGSMMVNSLALELANITKETQDPRNGYIVRDGLTEDPKGIMIDGAYAMITAAMPPTPIKALTRAYRDAIQYQTGKGVVGTKYVHVCENRLDALKIIDDAGDMTLRVEAAISWQDDIFPVRRRWELLAGERHYYRSAKLNANSVKFHFDGTTEPRTTYLLSPWPGENSWKGKLNLTPEHITDMVCDMDRRGIRVIAHCTGDGASDIFLDAIQEARRRNGPIGVRHQCAHSTVLAGANLKRFKELNVTAEFSPVGWFPSLFSSNARGSLGEDRLKRAYNVKGVLDAGGNVVIGTDWPVSHINPWIGFEALTTRENPWDEVEGQTGDPITLEQAIQVVTINGARAMEIEGRAGNIEVGKSADIIVLDRNLFEIGRKEIHDTTVELTITEGRVVYDKIGECNGSDHEAHWQGDLPDL